MRIGIFAMVMLTFCGMAVADERVTPAVYIAPATQATTNAQPQAPPRQLHALVSGFERDGTATPPPLPAPAPSAPEPPVVHAFTNNDLRQTSHPIQTVAQEVPRAEVPPATPTLPSPLLDSPTPTTPSLPTLPPAATNAIAGDDILDAAFQGRTSQSASTKLTAAGMPDVTKLVTVIGSLILVIGVFLLFSLFLKKVTPHATRTLPKEVFENLGRASLSPKIQLQLLRLGNRLVLVSVTVDGTSTVTEITDQDEVMQVLGMCRRLDTSSSTNAFRNVLNGTNIEPTPRAASSKPHSKPHHANDSLASILAAGLVKS